MSERLPVAASATTAAAPPAAVVAQPAVPWGTVLWLAAVMAYADGFWSLSLRGSVGAFGRDETPFLTWLQESTLLLPVFVAATLAALTAAARVFGPAVHGRAKLLTMFLIVGAGTVAGGAVLVANAAYDHYLQVQRLVMMSSMASSCGGDCLDVQRQASLALQLSAVRDGTAILLVTNLLLVSWAVALRGGRVDVSSTRPCTPGLRHPDRDDDLRLLLVATLVGSALIHAAVVPEHLAEWTASGAFFALLTLVQLGVAGLVWVRRGPLELLLAAALSAGLLLLWMWSRSAGLPFGPEAGAPEPIGVADLAAGALQQASVILTLVLLQTSGARSTRRPLSSHTRSLAVVTMVAVAVIGVGGSSLPGLGAFTTAHQGSSPSTEVDPGSSTHGH